MIDPSFPIMVAIDRLVAELEEDYPPQEIFAALTEYLEMADEFGYLR